jgi:hypothetical protein
MRFGEEVKELGRSHIAPTGALAIAQTFRCLSREKAVIAAVGFTKMDDARCRTAVSQAPQLQFGSRRAIPTIGRDRMPSSARSEP